jgi:gliding motility-associated-like protein
MKKINFHTLALIFLLIGKLTFVHAQSNVAIVLNEYSAANFTINDNYNVKSDWVEVRNAHTASVNLGGYYLSNDRFNLYKWKFPSTYTLAVGEIRVIWLSGRNEALPNSPNIHANFTLEQCKSQWLILTTAAGVVRDSVFVQKTQANHSRGRLNDLVKGISAWGLYATPSFSLPNPLAGVFTDYCPTPIFTPTPALSAVGGFYPAGSINQVDIYYPGGILADSAGSCFEVRYTIDGNSPSNAFLGGSTVYTGTNNPIFVVNTQVLRAQAYQRPSTVTPVTCTNNYLPSFIQTNTYFVDDPHLSFQQEFGVMSISTHSTDTNWFIGGGGAGSPTIHVEYFDNKQQVSEGYASMVRPPQESWITKQKGFYVSIDDRNGFGCDFQGNIFNVEGLGISSRTVFPTLHVKGGDFESHSTINTGTTGISYGTGIRDVFYQSIAIKNKLPVSPLHIKPIVVFNNGAYWGVYDLREVYDKHYEKFYNNQSRDSLDLLYAHAATDGTVTNSDGSASTFTNNFFNNIYNKTAGTSTAVPWVPMSNLNNYNNIMSQLDKNSFMDYMIMNSYAMNTSLWSHNIAFARGYKLGAPGNKWHYYLWNMPAIFNFTNTSVSGNVNPNSNLSPCVVHSGIYGPTPLAQNGHGNMLSAFMGTYPNRGIGSTSFQKEYKDRYQDLLNGPLKCENLLKQFDYIKNLYLKEMKYHEDPSSAPTPGKFSTILDTWDTNMVKLRTAIQKRCDYMKTAFYTTQPANCYGMVGPYDITVDVEPAGAGKVRVGTIIAPFYKWTGTYFTRDLPLKAISSDSTFVFHHWELKNSVPLGNTPLSVDSIIIPFNQPDDIIAVFTDKKNDIQMPTGFTPNGDGSNDVFRPYGSALFAKDYEFAIYSRWGQEVYRTTSAQDGWDGGYKGEPAQTGVYAYFIKYKNIYNEPKILKGNVTLVR